MLKVMEFVDPGFAFELPIAVRNEPIPESFVLVTTNVTGAAVTVVAWLDTLLARFGSNSCAMACAKLKREPAPNAEAVTATFTTPPAGIVPSGQSADLT